MSEIDGLVTDAAQIGDFAICDGVFVRPIRLAAAGDQTVTHQHTHNHVTLLAHGAVRAEVDGKARDFEAPAVIFIAKNRAHQFTALADDTMMYCVHALRDAATGDLLPEGAFIDPSVNVGKIEPLVRRV